MKKDNETQLVKSILEYLHARGVFAYRNNTGAVVSEYKGKKRFTRFGEAGSPDIVGCKNGQMICIECKMPGNKPTELQEAWLKRAYDAGALCLVAYSIDDVMKHI